jgi:hypothetical protein
MRRLHILKFQTSLLGFSYTGFFLIVTIAVVKEIQQA